MTGSTSLLTIIFMLTASFAMANPIKTEHHSEAGTCKLNQPLPAFSNPRLDQPRRTFDSRENLELTRNKNAPFVFSFFATWCGPCKAGIEAMAKEQAALKATGIKVVLINIGEKDTGAASLLDAFRREKGL